MISVAVVDDDRMFRDGLRSWLASVPRLCLVATAATVDELLAAPGTPADVTLLDLRLRDGSAPAANIARLRAAGTRVLVVSGVPDRPVVLAAVAAGADGYLTKDHGLPTLVAAVEEVAAGGTAHSAELAFAWAHDDSPARPRLSPKELEVLLGYASGLTLKATARRAGISPHTAKDYLDRVKAKYRQAGRPTYTKTDLAHRVAEDALAPDGPPPPWPPPAQAPPRPDRPPGPGSPGLGSPPGTGSPPRPGSSPDPPPGERPAGG